MRGQLFWRNQSLGDSAAYTSLDFPMLVSAHLTLAAFGEWSLDITTTYPLPAGARIIAYMGSSEVYEFVNIGYEKKWDGGRVYYSYRCPWSVYADLGGVLFMEKTYQAGSTSGTQRAQAIMTALLQYSPWGSYSADNSAVVITGDFTTENATVWDNIHRIMDAADLAEMQSALATGNTLIGLTVRPRITLSADGKVTARNVGIAALIAGGNPTLYLDAQYNAQNFTQTVDDSIHPSAIAPTFNGAPFPASGGQGFAYATSTNTEWGYYRAVKNGAQSAYYRMAFVEMGSEVSGGAASAWAVANADALTATSPAYRAHYAVPDEYYLPLTPGTLCTVQNADVSTVYDSSAAAYEFRQTLGTVDGMVSTVTMDLISGRREVDVDFAAPRIPVIQSRKV